MKIKKRNEILNDVIHEGKKFPDGWNAISGKDKKRLSRDYYLFHPKAGMYLLKEYRKNPFQINGVGGKIARKIDQDIETDFKKNQGDFGIVQGNFQKILKNLEKGIKPQSILDSAIHRKKDLGIKIPVRGKVNSSKKVFENIDMNKNKNKKKIDNKFEKIAYDDGLYKGFD